MEVLQGLMKTDVLNQGWKQTFLIKKEGPTLKPSFFFLKLGTCLSPRPSKLYFGTIIFECAWPHMKGRPHIFENASFEMEIGGSMLKDVGLDLCITLKIKSLLSFLG